ncbi:MAG: ABC transporter permease subunit [Chloroflexi bacterium]|nr:ABC transporter permease subunit [Chloroflexota bacterium]
MEEVKLAWRLVWWGVFIAGAAYFLLPLIGTLAFSLRAKGVDSAYLGLLANKQFVATLSYSFVIGIVTIIVSIVLIVPTAFWVRLRLPQARPFVEFVTLLPFVVPPVVLVFGLIASYARPPLSLTNTDMGLNVLLVAGYVVLSLPYMYRAVDTGLGVIDVHSLTEAAQSLGAGWPTILVKVILPNIRVAVLSGAFLTLAIVVGEFTIATFLARPAFAPFLGLLGSSAPFQQSAAALLSFGLTWIAMILIAWLGRGSQSRISMTGAR